MHRALAYGIIAYLTLVSCAAYVFGGTYTYTCISYGTEYTGVWEVTLTITPHATLRRVDWSGTWKRTPSAGLSTAQMTGDILIRRANGTTAATILTFPSSVGTGPTNFNGNWTISAGIPNGEALPVVVLYRLNIVGNHGWQEASIGSITTGAAGLSTYTPTAPPVPPDPDPIDSQRLNFTHTNAGNLPEEVFVYWETATGSELIGYKFLQPGDSYTIDASYDNAEGEFASYVIPWVKDGETVTSPYGGSDPKNDPTFTMPEASAKSTGYSSEKTGGGGSGIIPYDPENMDPVLNVKEAAFDPNASIKVRDLERVFEKQSATLDTSKLLKEETFKDTMGTPLDLNTVEEVFSAEPDGLLGESSWLRNLFKTVRNWFTSAADGVGGLVAMVTSAAADILDAAGDLGLTSYFAMPSITAGASWQPPSWEIAGHQVGFQETADRLQSVGSWLKNVIFWAINILLFMFALNLLRVVLADVYKTDAARSQQGLETTVVPFAGTLKALSMAAITVGGAVTMGGVFTTALAAAGVNAGIIFVNPLTGGSNVITTGLAVLETFLPLHTIVSAAMALPVITAILTSGQFAAQTVAKASTG